jgi:thymidylate synthase
MPRCPTRASKKQSCRTLCGHHHEPLTDGGYIPCVSLLDFQETGGKLDMTAYGRALDFGCKAYVNLVMLHLIQKEIAEKTGIPCGKLILIVKSAHFYLRDREKVLAIIDKVL